MNYQMKKSFQKSFAINFDFLDWARYGIPQKMRFSDKIIKIKQCDHDLVQVRKLPTYVAQSMKHFLQT